MLWGSLSSTGRRNPEEDLVEAENDLILEWKFALQNLVRKYLHYLQLFQIFQRSFSQSGSVSFGFVLLCFKLSHSLVRQRADGNLLCAQSVLPFFRNTRFGVVAVQLLHLLLVDLLQFLYLLLKLRLQLLYLFLVTTLDFLHVCQEFLVPGLHRRYLLLGPLQLLSQHAVVVLKLFLVAEDPALFFAQVACLLLESLSILLPLLKAASDAGQLPLYVGGVDGSCLKPLPAGLDDIESHLKPADQHPAAGLRLLGETLALLGLAVEQQAEVLGRGSALGQLGAELGVLAADVTLLLLQSLSDVSQFLLGDEQLDFKQLDYGHEFFRVVSRGDEDLAQLLLLAVQQPFIAFPDLMRSCSLPTSLSASDSWLCSSSQRRSSRSRSSCSRCTADTLLLRLFDLSGPRLGLAEALQLLLGPLQFVSQVLGVSLSLSQAGAQAPSFPLLTRLEEQEVLLQAGLFLGLSVLLFGLLLEALLTLQLLLQLGHLGLCLPPLLFAGVQLSLQGGHAVLPLPLLLLELLAVLLKVHLGERRGVPGHQQLGLLGQEVDSSPQLGLLGLFLVPLQLVELHAEVVVHPLQSLEVSHPCERGCSAAVSVSACFRKSSPSDSTTVEEESSLWNPSTDIDVSVATPLEGGTGLLQSPPPAVEDLQVLQQVKKRVKQGDEGMTGLNRPGFAFPLAAAETSALVHVTLRSLPAHLLHSPQRSCGKELPSFTQRLPVDRSSSLLSERLLLMNGATVREEACREEKLRLLRRRRAGFAGSDVGLVVWWLPLPLLPAALLPVAVESLPWLLFPPAVLGALLEFCLPPIHPLSSFKRKRQKKDQQTDSSAKMAQANSFEANSSQIQVEHDKKRRQFVIRLNGSHDRAVLLYEYVGKKTVDLQHTEVPDAYRGRGIAKHLAKAAMDFVVEEDLKAHLTCWYIQKYVKENPQPQYFEHIHQ
ncbi:hypothetical protein CCH79_00013582 [Gambusia affinis]|uniref:Protein NATD1 n=2 Tax=Gambusia affinis TaxID=33528 RepID=A0A315WBG0_GAMAF|nr:hypothetical protein CCH79_00013582 [Gambusia affinis]